MKRKLGSRIVQSRKVATATAKVFKKYKAGTLNVRIKCSRCGDKVAASVRNAERVRVVSVGLGPTPAALQNGRLACKPVFWCARKMRVRQKGRRRTGHLRLLRDVLLWVCPNCGSSFSRRTFGIAWCGFFAVGLRTFRMALRREESVRLVRRRLR